MPKFYVIPARLNETICASMYLYELLFLMRRIGAQCAFFGH